MLTISNRLGWPSWSTRDKFDITGVTGASLAAKEAMSGNTTERAEQIQKMVSPTSAYWPFGKHAITCTA